MKRYFFAILIAFLTASHAYCQNLDLPTIRYDLLEIKKNDGASIKMGTSMNEFHKTIGEPDSISTFYGEIDEVYLTQFFYGRNEFTFIESRGLVSFSIITSNELSVGINGEFIKKQDDIKSVKKMYPELSQLKGNEGWSFYTVDQNNKVVCECTFYISYNKYINEVLSMGLNEL